MKPIRPSRKILHNCVATTALAVFASLAACGGPNVTPERAADSDACRVDLISMAISAERFAYSGTNASEVVWASDATEHTLQLQYEGELGAGEWNYVCNASGLFMVSQQGVAPDGRTFTTTYEPGVQTIAWDEGAGTESGHVTYVLEGMSTIEMSFSLAWNSAYVDSTDLAEGAPDLVLRQRSALVLETISGPGPPDEGSFLAETFWVVEPETFFAWERRQQIENGPSISSISQQFVGRE